MPAFLPYIKVVYCGVPLAFKLGPLLPYYILMIRKMFLNIVFFTILLMLQTFYMLI